MNPLSFSPSASVADLRRAIVTCGRICYERRLVTSNDGNISARLDEGRILITPSGISKGRLDADDLLIVDMDGHILSALPGRKPSSETAMHLEVYRQRSEARAALHAHPVFATALTAAGLEFPTDILPEALLALGDVPVTAYATPSSQADAEAVRPFLARHKAILLRQHGSLTIGRDLDEALIHLERIEHVAEVFWRARVLGEVERIPASEQENLRRLREQLFHG